MFNISFTVNTDGVNKFSSSRAGHLWPVYIMINELAKEYRFKKKYIIPAYMYCDKHDPNMLTFLSPSMDKLNALHEKGIDIDSAEGHINFRYLLFVTMADLPARAELMNMKHFNAKCACHLCKSEGKGYGLTYTVAGHSKKTNLEIMRINCLTLLPPRRKRQSWVLKVTQFWLWCCAPRSYMGRVQGPST